MGFVLPIFSLLALLCTGTVKMSFRLGFYWLLFAGYGRSLFLLFRASLSLSVFGCSRWCIYVLNDGVLWCHCKLGVQCFSGVFFVPPQMLHWAYCDLSFESPSFFPSLPLTWVFPSLQTPQQRELKGKSPYGHFFFCNHFSLAHDVIFINIYIYMLLGAKAVFIYTDRLVVVIPFSCILSPPFIFSLAMQLLQGLPLLICFCFY